MLRKCDTIFCKKCKKEIDDGSVYCRFCGKKQVETSRAKKTKKRPNGAGNITLLSGKREKPYWARKSIGGKVVSLGTYATKTEAFIALEQANNHTITAIHDYTVEQIYEMLVEQNKDKLTKSGLTNYISAWKYLSPYAKMKMRDVRTVHFQAAINNAQTNGIGYSTWKKIQNLGSLMCKIAMANDLIDKNYAQLITFPEAPERTDKVTFSTDQLRRLWQYWENDDTITAILAMCYNGLRINEFLDLKKEHVDMEERVIYAPGSKTTAGKNRIIAIPEDVLPLYQKMIKAESEYLCPSPQGTRWDAKNFRDRAFYKVLEKYGLDTNEKGERITPHSCRHTYAALCVKNNLNEKATMDLMGHSKYSTTVDLYAESTKKDIEFLRAEADKIRKESPANDQTKR